jgi:DNA repair exonuclease SbcCD ATPase subunit
VNKERMKAIATLEDIALSLALAERAKVRHCIDVIGRADSEIVRLESLVATAEEALRAEAEDQAKAASLRLAADKARVGEEMARARALKEEAAAIRDGALRDAHATMREAVDETRNLRALLAAERQATERERETLRALRAAIGRSIARAAQCGQLSIYEAGGEE